MRALGVDVSLRGTGLCLLPAGWFARGKPDWSVVKTETIGYGLNLDATENERAKRLLHIAGAVKLFARRYDADHAVIEQYAFSKRGAHTRAIGEVGGCVRVGLHAEGVDLHVATASEVRKCLLGHNPTKLVKVPVQRFLKRMGAPFADRPDECDAFALANWFLGEQGFCFVGMAA
jgi:Holliday junction resolvasome RuvABC endonuclease subunit